MIAIVKSNFNQPITDALLASCKQTLESNGVDYKVFEVPGAIETVGTSKRLLSSPVYKAIIVIGAVIKGDTDHYDYVCSFVTQGLTILSTQSDIPIIFGILTTQNEEQALDRALSDRMNKGKEFAETAIEMIGIYHQL
ncbi:MAG TPA: 6,7-dimethyl-8-ribityllumazine synthase [Chitinophagaceae bacterium]|nr:6,7-dimethyl-8-ribityllumazine synthase [Chitinophagaceae bacterium]